MKLSAKLFAGFVIILALFTAVALVNLQLSEDVIENSKWVSRSQNVVRNSAALHRNIIDMEAGLRGYLLNGNPTFLRPYVQAKQELPSLFNELKALTIDTPKQTRKINKIIALQAHWQNDLAEPLVSLKQNATVNTDTRLYHTQLDSLILHEKTVMDSIRVGFSRFNALEYQVRNSRRDRLNQSITTTRQVSTILTILSVIIGLSWAYYITRLITGRIVKMVRLAEQISQGDYKTRIVDTSRDELSHLSDSLNRMSTTIDASFSELDRKNKELDQFAYVVSHDLKAPLRGIEVASRWVEEDMGKELPLHMQEYLMMMRVRVHRMENLINGILALARIGRTEEIKEEVDVNQLLSEVVDMLSVPDGYKLRVQDNMPTLYTVQIRLQQVFSNLISNALKYNHKAAGQVVVAYHEQDQFHVFSVSDDGPGIDPAYHERIFGMFQTLQERDAVESTGVGLAIVKKIVERQGGTISVTSTPNEGATFTFTWPRNET